MQTAEFPATAILEGRSFDDHPNMGLVDEAWSVVTGLQAFNRFRIAFTGT